MSSMKLSPALAFITAGFQALPKTMGERERADMMCQIHELALKSRMRFDLEDGAQLSGGDFRLRSCVGVFNPLDPCWYALACKVGGTFARMWEKREGTKPWMAPEVLVPDQRETLANNRVAPGLGITLPFGDDTPDTNLQQWVRGQVWWCTSITDDALILCRYESAYAVQGRAHMMPERPNGKPARRRKLTRAQWAELVATLEAETAGAAQAA